MTDHLAPSLAAELILHCNYLGWAADVAPTSSKAFFGREQPGCVSEHTSIGQRHEINASQAQADVSTLPLVAVMDANLCSTGPYPGRSATSFWSPRHGKTTYHSGSFSGISRFAQTKLIYTTFRTLLFVRLACLARRVPLEFASLQDPDVKAARIGNSNPACLKLC